MNATTFGITRGGQAAQAATSGPAFQQADTHEKAAHRVSADRQHDFVAM